MKSQKNERNLANTKSAFGNSFKKVPGFDGTVLQGIYCYDVFADPKYMQYESKHQKIYKLIMKHSSKKPIPKDENNIKDKK